LDCKEATYLVKHFKNSLQSGSHTKLIECELSLGRKIMVLEMMTPACCSTIPAYDPVLARFISAAADWIVLGAPALTVHPFGSVAGGMWGTSAGSAGGGALIGGGIDLAVQLAVNGGDVHKVNWVEVGVSAAVGATGLVSGPLSEMPPNQSRLRLLQTQLPARLSVPLEQRSRTNYRR
jgi:hypothetical protein